MSKKRVSKPDDGLTFEKDDGLKFGDDDGLDFGGGADALFGDERAHPVEYPGTIEGDTAADIGHLAEKLRDAARRAEERFAAATDNEFWFTVFFESRAQKEAFLAAMRWLAAGDKYLDGVELAGKQGIRLPDASVPFVKEKPDRRLDELALPLPESE